MSDVLTDIQSMLAVTAHDPQEAAKTVEQLWKKCVNYFEGTLSLRFISLLKFIKMRLEQIPLKRDPRSVPVISLVGEIYVRQDEFSRKNLMEFLHKKGFMVRIAPLAEYICYSNYVVINGLGERRFNMQESVKMRLGMFLQDWWERKIKSILAGCGLYHFEMIEVGKTIAGVKHLINENFRGECILTVGLSMREILNSSCGVVAIGPFGCMYSRMAEAILNREMDREGKRRMGGFHRTLANMAETDNFPFLSIETDGNPFPPLIEANLEAFVLQAQRLHDRFLKGRSLQRDVFKFESVTAMLANRR